MNFFKKCMYLTEQKVVSKKFPKSVKKKEVRICMTNAEI